MPLPGDLNKKEYLAQNSRESKEEIGIDVVKDEKEEEKEDEEEEGATKMTPALRCQQVEFISLLDLLKSNTEGY